MRGVNLFDWIGLIVQILFYHIINLCTSNFYFFITYGVCKKRKYCFIWQLKKYSIFWEN